MVAVGTLREKGIPRTCACHLEVISGPKISQLPGRWSEIGSGEQVGVCLRVSVSSAMLELG